MKTNKNMTAKERIEELKGFATHTDYEWLTSNFIAGNALNKLHDSLGLSSGDEYSNPSTNYNLRKYKYAKQKLFDFIKEHVEPILELTLEEIDFIYYNLLEGKAWYFDGMEWVKKATKEIEKLKEALNNF